MVLARSAGVMLMVLAGLVVAGSPPLWQSQAQAAEPPQASVVQGRLQGRFTAADSGQPVAGAKVRLLIEGVPSKDKLAEDLPYRPHSMWARYGDSYAKQDVDFDAKSGECVITLQPTPKARLGMPGLPRPAR